MPALRPPVSPESGLVSVGAAPNQIGRADAASYHEVQQSSDSSPDRALLPGLTADSLLVAGTLTVVIGAYGARWIYPTKKGQERDVAELHGLLEACERCINIVSDFFEKLPPEERNDFYIKLDISEADKLQELYETQRAAVLKHDVEAKNMRMKGFMEIFSFVGRKWTLRRQMDLTRQAIADILERAEHSSSRVLEVQKKNVPNSAESDATPPVTLVEAHTIDELFEAPHLPGSFYGRAEEFEIAPVAEPIIIRMDEHPGMDVGISDDEDQIPRGDDMV